MSKLPWLVGGGAAIAYLWWRADHQHSDSPEAWPLPLGTLPGTWVWPVPLWNGRAPVISDGFDSKRPGFDRHGGVDIMFKRQASDRFPSGTPNGSKAFVMPDHVPALAAYDGEVWFAGKTPQGMAVVIDHRPLKVSTFYTHLEKLLVSPPPTHGAKQRVRAGEPIGIIGFSPLDAAKLKHLHFELRLGGPDNRIDPANAMRSWKVVPDPSALVARNARRFSARTRHV